MEIELSRILKRISKNEIKIILSRWGKIPTWKVEYMKPKYEVIQSICQIAQSCGIKLEEIHRLELLYYIENATKKSWRGVELKESTGLSLSEENFEERAFERCLKQKLYVGFSYSVQIIEENHALWGRISQPGSTQCVLFIYFPFSPFILITRNSQKLVQIVIRSLKSTLGYKKVKELDLESNHPDSLAQILLHNRNPALKYTRDDGYFKPLPRNDEESPRTSCDDRIKIFHLEKLKKAEKSIEQQFGNNLQPVLRLINIATKTRFRGRKHLPNVDDSQVMNCQTRFVGSNVLEGIRKLALLNFALTPLPKFLSSVGRTGAQSLKLSDRMEENMATTDRSSA